MRAEIQEVSQKFPNEILVGLNDRDPQLHDIWRINIETGEKKLVQQNPGVAGYLTDDDYNVRLAINYTPTGGQIWQVPEGEGEARTWKDFLEIGPEDAMTSGPAGFDKTGQTLYFQDSRNRNTSGLFAMDLKSGDTKLIADDPRSRRRRRPRPSDREEHPGRVVHLRPRPSGRFSTTRSPRTSSS